VAEYALILAVIVLLVVVTVRLIGSNSATFTVTRLRSGNHGVILFLRHRVQSVNSE
jgi:hypothetical protein